MQVPDQMVKGVNVASPIERDDEMGKMLHGTLAEAAERVTFHRIELERWERIGRAASRGLTALEQREPVAQQTPDGFGYETGEAVPAQSWSAT